jgi:hypothetical protein
MLSAAYATAARESTIEINGMCPADRSAGVREGETSDKKWDRCEMLRSRKPPTISGHRRDVAIGRTIVRNDASIAERSRNADMRFVLVKDRAPRSSSRCASCGSPLGVGYLRDSSSRLQYCGYECYSGSDSLAPLGLPQNLEAASLSFSAFFWLVAQANLAWFPLTHLMAAPSIEHKPSPENGSSRNKF